MTQPITTSAVASAPVTAAPSGKQSAPKVAGAEASLQPAEKTTVTLSSAAVAALAALKEAVETPAQTAVEAGHNDIQAQHLLAREQAQKASRA